MATLLRVHSNGYLGHVFSQNITSGAILSFHVVCVGSLVIIML